MLTLDQVYEFAYDRMLPGDDTIQLTQAEWDDIRGAAKAADVPMPSRPERLFGRRIVITDAPPNVPLIAKCAIEYVAARAANEAASSDAWYVALSRVDAAWAALVATCGFGEQ